MIQPPKKQNNIDIEFFENIIIYNAIMDDIYLSSIIDIVDLSYFKNQDIKIIFELILDFYKKRNIAPNLTELKAHLSNEDQKRSFKNVLLSFKQLDTNYNKEELIANTEQFFKEKAIYNAVLKTANEYSNNDKSVDSSETLSLFENACNISLVEDLGHDYFIDIDKHIKEHVESFSEKISSGYKWLDKKLKGGFLKEGRAMYVFSGVTNSGKSIILGNLATNIFIQNKVVILISLEMPESVYSQRIDSQLTRIPFDALRAESGNLKEQLVNFRDKHPHSKLIIKEYAPKSITVNSIKAYIKKIMAKKKIKPDVIIVDYVNLINSDIPTGKSYEDIKRVAEQLRAISYTFRCPVITATQLNRSAYEELNPGIETTSESMGLAMTADFQASVWSDEKDKELGIIHFGIQKNRFGENFGNIAAKIDYNTLAVDEMEEDETNNVQLNQAQSTLDILSK